MANCQKWLIFVPFTLACALGLPALITGRLLWFLDSWSDTLFVAFILVMWTGALLFVRSVRPKHTLNFSRIAIGLGLILIAPVSVYDRAHGPASAHGDIWSLIGVALCLLAIPVGVGARHLLGRNYSPEPEILPEQTLTTAGPYRYIRHPLYTACLTWGGGLALLARSWWGLAIVALILLPPILWRMREEESLLLETFGDAYRDYMARSWRLIPFLF